MFASRRLLYEASTRLIQRHSSTWARSTSFCWGNDWQQPRTLSLRPCYVTERFFARKVDRDSGPSVNEALVAELVRDRGQSADQLQVRMIVEGREGAPSQTSLVSLADAIQTSIEMDLDLIDISSNQDVPVVKVDSLKRLAYQKIRTSAKKAADPAEKELRFKPSIAEADMERKIDQMIGYLERGHRCAVQIRANRREMYRDPMAAKTMADRILERVQGTGELVSQPRVFNNMAQFSLRPISKRKS